jgi:hypothetical protein
MQWKLNTVAGRQIYAQRKVIVEPVYGQIKQARGFRQFLLRGIHKVQGEWALSCTGHNLLKLHRACTAWQDPARRLHNQIPNRSAPRPSTCCPDQPA